VLIFPTRRGGISHIQESILNVELIWKSL